MTEGGMTFGAELRRLRLAASLSLAELAGRIHYTKGYLSKLENGLARPNPMVAALCDAEFDTGGSLATMVPPDGPRTRSAPTRAALSVLPAVTAHFTGRGAEMEELLRRVSQQTSEGAGVHAVHGMAGVGKTALAVRCAHRLQSRFTDGCLFVDLHGHTPDAGEVTAGEALDRFLRFLGVPGEEIPDDVDDRAALYRDQLAGRSVLVVLDNARTTRQIVPLIPAEPRCRVLVTSRHRLAALDDAHHLNLDVLSRQQGAELLRTLVHDRLAEEEPDGDTEQTVDAVVARCGRLPLAIRIAAARLRTRPGWRLADLDRRLADEVDRLSELDDGERSVAAAFTLSYRDMSHPQRRLFGLLALHPGADLEIHSAAALAGGSTTSVERLLADLYDAHLLVAHSSGRYQFHDLLRAFARDTALAEIPQAEQRAALHRLLDENLYATDLVDRIITPQRHRRTWEYSTLSKPVPEFDEDTGSDWIRQEWPNLVALCRLAGASGFHDHCWRLAFVLRGFFFLTKLWDPWIATSQYALAAADATDDVWAKATTANNLGLVHTERGDLDEAVPHYQNALVLFGRAQDEYGTHTVTNNIAWLDYYRGDHASALRRMQSAFEFYQRTGLSRNAAITLRGLAVVKVELGRHTEALRDLADALAVFEDLGLDLDTAMAHNCTGWVHYRAGHLDAATVAYTDALDVSDRCGSTFEAARADTGLGNTAAASGHPDLARVHWQRAAQRHPHLDPTVVGEVGAQRALRPAVA